MKKIILLAATLLVSHTYAPSARADLLVVNTDTGIDLSVVQSKLSLKTGVELHSNEAAASQPNIAVQNNYGDKATMFPNTNGTYNAQTDTFLPTKSIIMGHDEAQPKASSYPSMKNTSVSKIQTNTQVTQPAPKMDAGILATSPLTSAEKLAVSESVNTRIPSQAIGYEHVKTDVTIQNKMTGDIPQTNR